MQAGTSPRTQSCSTRLGLIDVIPCHCMFPTHLPPLPPPRLPLRQPQPYQVEPTRLQSLALHFADKAAMFVEANERMLDSRTNMYGFVYDDDDARRSGGKKTFERNRRNARRTAFGSRGRGRGRGMRGRGGRRGGRRLDRRHYGGWS